MVELNLVRLKADNTSCRIDSEFFRKRFLTLPRFVNRLDDLAIIKSGTTPPDRDDELKEGVVLLKTTDIRNSLLLATDSYYHISHEIAARMQETKLMHRDVLINIVGATTDVIGRVAFVPDDFPEANITQAMALIRVHDQKVCPYTLFAFLSGCYGKAQVERLARPTGQYNLNLQEVASLRLPRISAELSKEIAHSIEIAYAATSKAEKLTYEAEQTLLSALGLEDWQSTNQHTAIKNFSQTFATSARLDAEYYQPKYDEILSRLHASPYGCVPLADCFEQNRSLSKLEKSAYHYIEIGDVSVSNGQATANCIETKELPPNARIESRKNELIVSKVRPYRGAIAIVESDEADLLVSTAFTVLRETGRYKKEVLQILLRTKVYKELLMQPSVGTSYPVIRDEDVMALPIPDLPIAMQQQIANKVQSAQAARRQSQQLLELAKQTVERAIETSEAEALDWLQTQLHQIVG